MVNLKHIKAIITDVDGVLTDGSITIHDDGSESKTFNVKDGTLCAFIKSQGIFLGIISGRKTENVIIRSKQLGFDFTHLGVKNKLESLNEFKSQFNLGSEDIIYIGDDINDLVIKDQVKYFISPSDAHISVIRETDWKTSAKGGHGVLREVFDNLVEQKGWEVELQSYYKLNEFRESI